jgi:hypothetical protein
MFVISRLLLLLPLAVAWPSFIQCTDDEATRLKLGTTIMGAKVVPAKQSVTMQVLRNGQAVSSYIPGEVLEVHVKGFPERSSAILRANDESNTTIQTENTNGIWEAQCANQIHVSKPPIRRNLPGTEATVSFRPGCNSKEPLKLTFVTASTFGVPLYLSELSLKLEGKQDPSCTVPPSRFLKRSAPHSHGRL